MKKYVGIKKLSIKSLKRSFKKAVKIFALITTAFAIFIICESAFPAVCPAYDGTDFEEYEEELKSYDFSAFEELNDESKNLLEDFGLYDFDYRSIGNISFKEIISYIGKVISSKAAAPIKAFCTVLCLIIMSSLIKTFSQSSANPQGDAYTAVSNLLIAIYTVSQIKDAAALACETLKLCADFTYAFFPVFCVICASSGSAAASFSVNGSLLLLSQGLNFISADVFLPVTNCFTAISVCSSIRRDLNLSSIVSAAKKLITKAISALSALFVSYLSFKTAVASRADALGLRSVRFAINSVVPVIGSSISEGLLSIQSYSSLVKTSVGIVGIIAIASVFLPAIASTTLWRISLSGANICARVFFDSDAGAVLESFCSVLLIINVLLILSMVTTIISLGILVASKSVS